jgi:hypothetical protein
MGTNTCTIPGIKIRTNTKIVARLSIYRPIENDSIAMYRHK